MFPVDHLFALPSKEPGYNRRCSHLINNPKAAIFDMHNENGLAQSVNPNINNLHNGRNANAALA